MSGTGMLVDFEGIDGSGKSTQARLLYEAIRKTTDKCTLTNEPSDSPITRLIREELKKDPSKGGDALDMRALQLLFVADRSVHVERVIKPGLEAGRIVVTDRYILSTVAYGAAFGNDYGLTAEYLMKVNSIFPQPDLVFYIRIAPEAVLRRISKRNGQPERFDNLDSLRKLDDSYRNIAQRHYSGEGSPWREIDGDRYPQQVAQDVLAAWEERGGRR
jgi:dTMP kinase